jgi:NAD(P)-dependent dehydrogenase (short-subunit alcohol dehydrogenase family)
MGAMDGRTCLVTGATNGIGKVAARELLRLGAEVLLVARDPARGQATLAELEAAGPGRASLLVADLGVQAQVRRLAAEVLERAPRLHVLLNNAGAIHMQRAVTADGLEATFAVNHLGAFLLTRLLEGRLRESAPARVVNVASAAHQGVAGLSWDDLMGERQYAGFQAYAQSKLANILFTAELARRLDGSGVTANALHPGVVRTGFGHNTRGWLRWGVKLAGPLFLSPERGADTAVWLCASPEVAGVSGGYFARRRPARRSAAARDAVAAKRLWEVSERLTGLAPPNGR